MNEEEYHQVIELALSMLHERAQVDEDFVENILDRFEDMTAEDLKELIANVFYSH
jgi:mannitol/fructose-specific phosphotransferase system IIA component